VQEPQLILSFDIEDWFHILDNPQTDSMDRWHSFESRVEAGTDRIIDFLQKHQLQATFFCLGWVGQKYPHVIKKIASAGYEIGSHTFAHQLTYKHTPHSFKTDLIKSIDILQQISSQAVTSFRAPGFSFTEQTKWAFEILVECGICTDSSIFPAPRGHGGYAGFTSAGISQIQTPSGVLKEFPINILSLFSKRLVFSGGGYFRLLPGWFITLATKHQKQPYVMTYFHPRDFDAHQPLLPGLSKFRKFKSYYGLAGAFKKFEHYVKRFKTTDVQTACASIDWATIELLKL